MDVMAPLSAVDEVEPLVRGGATDLYCGVFDAVWARRFGLGAWPNRRGAGPANLDDVDTLAVAADRTHRAGARIHLVVNAPLLDESQEAAVTALARHAVADLGVDGLVVANPGLLRPLADTGALLTTSTLCTVRNTEAALLLSDLGAHRVILSRQLCLSEIRSIAAAAPAVQFEAFVLNDACAFEEGSCLTAHALPTHAGPYCLAERTADRTAEGGTDASWARHGQWLAALAAGGFSRAGLPRGPCGLCALPDLAAAGIDGVKVVGREAHPYRKVRSVQMVRHVLDALPDAVEARSRALALRDDPPGCRAGLSCLYPEVRPDHG